MTFTITIPDTMASPLSQIAASMGLPAVEDVIAHELEPLLFRCGASGPAVEKAKADLANAQKALKAIHTPKVTRNNG